MSKLYLAGPITGLSWKAAADWRDYVTQALEGTTIVAFSPLRGKKYLKGEKSVQSSYEAYPLSTQKGITSRDHWDVLTSDCIMAYVLGADKPSLGTVLEIGWAHAYRKPIIMIMEKEGNPHNHPMIREIVSYTTADLDEGITLIKTLLLP